MLDQAVAQVLALLPQSVSQALQNPLANSVRDWVTSGGLLAAAAWVIRAQAHMQQWAKDHQATDERRFAEHDTKFAEAKDDRLMMRRRMDGLADKIEEIPRKIIDSVQEIVGRTEMKLEDVQKVTRDTNVRVDRMQFFLLSKGGDQP